MKNQCKLEPIGSVCEAGGRINEDVVGHAVSGGWVIDGATSVMGVQTLPCQSDAAWFAGQIDGALRAEIESTEPSVKLLHRIVAKVAAEFKALAIRPEAKAMEKPSASLAMVRLITDQIEQTILGDCSIIQLNQDGHVENFGHSRVTTFDQELVDELVRLRAAGVSSGDLAARIRQMERQIRNKMNSEDGYWILDTEGGGVKSSLIRYDPVLPNSFFLILSDGFRRLIDMYHAHDEKSLVRTAVDIGLPALYQQLRNIEAGDPDAKLFPRVKHQDDASALLLLLSA
jgi:serine/threonine protein phosphatase PrpC